MKNWEKYQKELAGMLAEDPEADYYLATKACYMAEAADCTGCPFKFGDCLLTQEWLNEEADT